MNRRAGEDTRKV